MPENNISKIIDNKKVVFLDELKKLLPSAYTLDIQTGYFFFSGFSALADDLKDIKMRIIVGMEIDPKVVKLKKITEDYDLSSKALLQIYYKLIEFLTGKQCFTTMPKECTTITNPG